MKNKFLTVLFLCLIVFLISRPVHAGDRDKHELRKSERKARDKYLGLGIGSSFIKVRDEATSPLLYKGFEVPFVSLGYLTHSEKVIKTLETDFSFGWLKTRTQTPWYDQRNTSYYLAIRYNWLYRLPFLKEKKIRWYLGPELNINGHFRVNFKFDNSAFTFDNYNGIGFANRFELPFGYKSSEFKFLGIHFKRRDRNLRLSWQLSMPLASFVIRPTYVTITNFIDPELQRKITPEQVTGGIFIPFAVRSQTELYYLLHNGNMFKLSYVWSYFSHDPGYNKVQTAFHGLLFSFIFKFNYKAAEQ